MVYPPLVGCVCGLLGWPPRQSAVWGGDHFGGTRPEALRWRRTGTSSLHAHSGGTQLCDLAFAGPPSANCNAGEGGGMNARAHLLAEATKRILLTDGAFGTEIQSYRLDEAAYADRKSVV